MRRRNFYKPFFSLTLFTALAGVLFVYCAGAPHTSLPEEEGGELALLPQGGKVYFWADTVKARPLIETLSFEGISFNTLAQTKYAAQTRYAAQILDSTKTAAAVIFGEGQSRRFFLAAAGTYPLSKANFSLTFSRDWKKQKSQTGNNFWYSPKDDLAMALGSKLALVSNIDPLEEFPALVTPPGFSEFRKAYALAGWMPDPSESIAKFFDTLGIPLQIPAEKLFFGAVNVNAADQSHTEKDPWQLVFRLETQSAAFARSLISFFSVARLFVLRGTDAGFFTASPLDAAALLFANLPEQDDDSLVIKTASIGVDEIALLFQMFSIYSN